MTGFSKKLGSVGTLLLLGAMYGTEAYAQGPGSAVKNTGNDNLPTFALPDGLAPARQRTLTPDEIEFNKQIAGFVRVLTEVKKLSSAFHDVTSEKMMEGAMAGALKALDPHSSYFNPEEYQDLKTEMTGHYSGTGMTIETAGQLTVVVAPKDDSPAAQAGIKAGDYIVAVGDNAANLKSILGQTSRQVANKLKGAAGTTVAVKLVREGNELPVVTMTRADIVTPAVTKVAMIGDIGYIRLANFDSHNTAREVEDAVAKLQADSHGQVAGFIVDGRNNGGGLVRQVVRIADDFIDGSGNIVSQKSPIREQNEVYNAHPGDITGGKPLAMLINRGSASATEILAAAIQDNNRGEIIGETSFGKGIVQTVVPLSDLLNDPARRDGVAVTIAYHHRPLPLCANGSEGCGATIQDHGVKPNLAFRAAADAKKKWRPAEADMPGALGPKEIPQPEVRNDGTCSPVNSNLPTAGLDPNLLDKDGKPDFELACGVEFLHKAAGHAPAGLVNIEPAQAAPSIVRPLPAPAHR